MKNKVLCVFVTLILATIVSPNIAASEEEIRTTDLKCEAGAISTQEIANLAFLIVENPFEKEAHACYS
ncbi:MAG: hypothetical protein GFH27_549301n240 [Chloroflexi bacterium AL-W]|nr:hypothetical protein [Chloroflexi bacterium AL-N1]NOK68434.1 hypothetical protein [Chloroflexi bacterium AL-N10]NOK74080.1 hypothetical protein [Chloroflexi bacterium AL-N5]NOK83047.1 hypothetical protein [Chloroflexi bacterium AL-W]NOK90570.1 hypothetical protein [Chloroflexi bacterium AL-N15]